MDLWLNSSWLLLLVPLLLRLVPLPSDRDDPWRLGLDLPLALLCALGTAAFKFTLFAPAHLGILSFFSSDEPMICSTLLGLSTGEFKIVERQPGAALLSGLLSRSLGAVDALAWSAMTATAALGATWYLLARLLHGRTAGLAAALFSCALPPLALMPRNLTFYPVATACMLFCTLAGVVALLRRDRWAVGLAGVGAGAALLGDAVGLFYAGPTLLIGLVRALQGEKKWSGWRDAPHRELALRAALLLLPLLVSFGVARVITPRHMWGLESQIQKYHAMNLHAQIPAWATRMERKEQLPGDPAPPEVSAPVAWLWERMPDLKSHLRGQDYLWGHSTPLEMGVSVWRVFLLSFAELHPEKRVLPGRGHIDTEKQLRVMPWIPLLLLSLGVSCWALWSRRWVLAGVLFLLLPYAMALRNQMATWVFPRLLFTPMAAWPVIMGVAWAALSQRRDVSGKLARSPWARPLTPAVTGALLVLMISGAVPSFLSLRAARHQPMDLQGSVFQRLAQETGIWRVRRLDLSIRENLRLCSELFHDQWRRGVDSRGTLFGQWWKH